MGEWENGRMGERMRGKKGRMWLMTSWRRSDVMLLPLSRELTWLSAKDNKIDGLNSIQKLLKMQILNIGNNREKSLLPPFQPISHRELNLAICTNVASLCARQTGVQTCTSAPTDPKSQTPPEGSQTQNPAVMQR
jgi:hypothetical protein